MELGHLPYKDQTYEDYVGQRGLEHWGKHKWRNYVADVVTRLIAALEPDDVVLGGGNVKQLEELPPSCRAGDNANAFLGGFRLWENIADGRRSGRVTTPLKDLHNQTKGSQIWKQQ
jgi:polyphosphate glucokinase